MGIFSREQANAKPSESIATRLMTIIILNSFSQLLPLDAFLVVAQDLW